MNRFEYMSFLEYISKIYKYYINLKSMFRDCFEFLVSENEKIEVKYLNSNTPSCIGSEVEFIIFD